MRDRHPGDLLSAFLDDELTEDEALDVTRHLGDCPSCLDDLDALRQARSALRDLPTVGAPTAWLDDVPVMAAGVDRRRGRLRVVSGTGSLLVGLLAVAFLVGADSGGDVVPPVEVVVVDHVVRTGGGPMIQPVTFTR